ncbi:MAG TPA: histidine kinase [Terracidiphilus sp.]|nr:histidine kinase [Terracidiphilus sp.]
MKLSHLAGRRTLAALLLCLLAAVTIWGIRAYRHSSGQSLPYHDSFAKGKADEWKALGGTWEISNGVMRNDSDELGAKLLTGSPYWHNYLVEADVSLLGVDGDAGLVIRSSNEEEGVDSYNGYYAGIRTKDNSLVLGRAEGAQQAWVRNGWLEATKQSLMLSKIRPLEWFHLKLLAYGCQIAASVTTASQAAPTVLTIKDANCLASGRFGLRSYSSGGAWRNVAVRVATSEDLAEMLQNSRTEGNQSLQNAPIEDPAFTVASPQLEQQRTSTIVQSVGSLRLASFAHPVHATIRGVVILTTPLLFVQDSTGGAYVPWPNAPPLKVGDEVEVTGNVSPGDFSSTIEQATVHLLWQRTPMPPVSVTASQASTGKFDATFIEVRGRLAAKERGPGDALTLDMDEGPQSFRAVLSSTRGDQLFEGLRPGSILQLRGICVVDPKFTQNRTPFVLLLRSNEDLQILAGPPWWSTGHIVLLALLTLFLGLLVTLVYQRIEHWRFNAVLQERERLAQEMHDTLAQSFAGVGFQLQAIRSGMPAEMTELHRQLDLANTLVRRSHEEARRSITTLRPEWLKSEDVVSALETSARHMVAGGVVQVFTEREGDQRTIPLRIADALFRIGQEAVANAVRHGNPSMLKLHIEYQKNLASLEIQDDGSGFIPGQNIAGFGVPGMRKRAQDISAKLTIESQPGKGTRVVVTAPLPPRMTFTSWPRLWWTFIKEHGINAGFSKRTNSYSYRG